MTRVEIDLNVRVRGNWTYTGLEDADGPVEVGDIVQVFEPESGLEGHGRVEEVDEARQLIYLSVDWASVREPDDRALSADDATTFRIFVYWTQKPAVAAGLLEQAGPTPVAAVAAVTCST